MHISFISWNLQRKRANALALPMLPLDDTPYTFLQLVEAGRLSDQEVLAQLPKGFYPVNPTDYYPQEELGSVSGVRRYTNLPRQALDYQFEGRHAHFLGVRIADRPVMMVGLHFPSKWSKTEQQQADYIRQFQGELLPEQFQVWHRRHYNSGQDDLLLLGDFNVNPYELGMVHQEGFHASASAELVQEKMQRSTAGRAYPKLYNLMWSMLGDFIPGSGTTKLPESYFYRQASETDEYHWHLLTVY